MNLVSLLVATSVVKYSHNDGLRTGVALGAVIIVVAAVVISKRRSTSIAAGEPGGGSGRRGRAGPERGDRRRGRGRRGGGAGEDGRDTRGRSEAPTGLHPPFSRGRRAVLGVGGLDVVAGDAEQVQDRVEVRDAERGVGGVPDRGLGVERDAQARRRDHVEVVGPVADRHGLAQRDPGPGREVAQRGRLARPGRSTGPVSWPVSLPPAISSVLAAAKSRPRSAASASVNWVKPPLTMPHR